mgnify:CR=1 FL=1
MREFSTVHSLLFRPCKSLYTITSSSVDSLGDHVWARENCKQDSTRANDPWYAGQIGAYFANDSKIRFAELGNSFNSDF